MRSDFRTILPVQRADFSMQHSNPIALIGSCFTEHIADKLEATKFPVLVNPFGIVYNPISIAHCLERLWAGNQPFIEESLFESQGLWHSWEHHGDFSHPDRPETLLAMNAAYQTDAAALRRTERLLLTLGTADVFYLRETGQIVANNHKMPTSLFQSRRLSIAEIVVVLTPVLQKMAQGRPDFRVILTVSPVRHLRLGLVENQRSKAALLLACAELCTQLPFATYFPAYELVLDDLRDYRFYTHDMLHPSPVAVEYIWQYFAATFFEAPTQRLIGQIEKIVTAAQHRSFHPDIKQARDFAAAQLDAITRLSIAYPALDFTKEFNHFQRLID